jgi:hypothetical protein
MRYLPFDTEQAARERNMIEAFRRGCDMVTSQYWWPTVDGTDGKVLNVGDGDGLSEEELERCVIEIGLTMDDYTIFKTISEDGVITDQEKQENPSLWDKIKSWWNS